ncbi:MAG: ABC transporter permease, partial [Acidobacteriota bacterium]
MQTFLQDVRYGFRMLAKTPGFTAVAIITLALGIGANTAIFSVVNAVLLRPFPFHQPDRLFVIWERQSQMGLPYMFASPPNYADWREQNQVFEEIAAFDPRGFFLKEADESIRVQGARVTASLFATLKVLPLAGRVFTEEEDRPNAPRVVVLGYGLWRERFHEDRNVIGQAVTINEESHTIIGVMPPSFKFPPPINLEGGSPDQKTDLWVPFAMDMKSGQRGAHFMRVIARLKPDVTPDRASEEMNAIARRLEQSFSETNKGWDVTLAPFSEQVLGEIRPALVALMAAVGLVLLIASVNIANLMLARGAARQKEMAIRSALGAGRWRIVRQLITESLLLALAGGAAGLVVASAGIDILIKYAPRDVPRLEDANIDVAVMAFTLAVSLVTGVLFGLAPAIRTFSLDLNQWLKEGGRSVEGGRMRLGSALVVVEVALSLALLVGAGLLFQSFLRLSSVETGFVTKNALTMRMTLPQSKYAGREQRIAAYREMERSVRSSPEIEAAGFVLEIPLAADRQGTTFLIEGAPPPAQGEEPRTNFTFTTPGYFEAMGIPLLKGRAFNEQDSAGSQNVVIINWSLARRFFSDEDPVGKHIYV